MNDYKPEWMFRRQMTQESDRDAVNKGRVNFDLSKDASKGRKIFEGGHKDGRKN